jgi:hypothetical protein
MLKCVLLHFCLSIPFFSSLFYFCFCALHCLFAHSFLCDKHFRRWCWAKTVVAHRPSRTGELRFSFEPLFFSVFGLIGWGGLLCSWAAFSSLPSGLLALPFDAPSPSLAFFLLKRTSSVISSLLRVQVRLDVSLVLFLFTLHGGDARVRRGGGKGVTTSATSRLRPLSFYVRTYFSRCQRGC